MITVDKSSLLATSSDSAWYAATTVTAFKLVTRGVLRFPAVAKREGRWRQGEVAHSWVYLFGVLPITRHRILVDELSDNTRTLVTREGGGLIREWNHTIIVVPVDANTCEYRDRVEIDAGVFTPIVAAYARWMYRTRQRRWVQLAHALPRATT